MKRHTENHGQHETSHLMEDAKALLAATSDAAEEKVIEARDRLAATIETGKRTWNNVAERATSSAKTADKAIRSHPYQTAAIAFGVGALIGYLLRARRSN